MKNIVLIGFMGTGKTTIGRLLARRLGRRFIDLDKEVEQETGLSISKIFTTHGEAYFRHKERMLVSRVARYHNTIISTGGGVVMDADNIAVLRQNGIIISLTASVEVIAERTERWPEKRPLLDRPDRQDVIARLIAEREMRYKDADIIIDTSHLSPLEVTDQIVALLTRGNYLK